MRKFQILLFVLISQLIFCQNVLLSKVDKMNDNTDKFLILLPEKMEQAEYLGEIEVQGFSNDDALKNYP